MASILRKQGLELLSRTRDILEEILESVEVARDKSILNRLREGQHDLKTGRVRSYRDFAKKGFPNPAGDS